MDLFINSQQELGIIELSQGHEGLFIDGISRPKDNN